MINGDTTSVFSAKDDYFALCKRYSKRLIYAIMIHLYICRKMRMTAFEYFVSCTSDAKQQSLQKDVYKMIEHCDIESIRSINYRLSLESKFKSI